MYNTNRDLHARIILNDVLKHTLDNVYQLLRMFSCQTHKQFHQMLLSHVTVADPDSSDSGRLYPNEHYGSI